MQSSPPRRESPSAAVSTDHGGVRPSIVSDSSGTVRRLFSSPPPQLTAFNCRFTDPELEAAFSHATWPMRDARIRMLMAAASVVLALRFGVDAVHLRGSTGLSTMLAIRGLEIAAILVFGWWALRRGALGRDESPLLIAAVAAVSAGTVATIPLLGMSLQTNALSAIILLLGVYLVAPFGPCAALSTGLAFSSCFLVVAFGSLPGDAAELALAALYIGLVNVVGFLISMQMQRLRRGEFAYLSRERQTSKERQRMADELQRQISARSTAETALAESELRFRSLVEMSPDAIAVHRDGRIIYVNPAGVRLMRADGAHSLLGRNILDLVAADHQSRTIERMRQIRDTDRLEDSVETVIRLLDGEAAAAEIISGPTVFDGKPAIQSVVRDISHRKDLERQLTLLATTDPLTGAWNRRHFFERGEEEWRRAKRHRRPLSLMVLDLDRFKQVNDRHGHAAGDALLSAQVKAAQISLRATDILARIGGEEFAVLLPEVEVDAATTAADRLRLALAAVEVPVATGVASCTVSIGVTACRFADETLDEALLRADSGLYLAKSEGRDRVRVV